MKTANKFIMPNGEEVGIGGVHVLFDTKLADHVLSYEETYGWALQGTYVYKEAVAGSRYGYPDFYNKCVEEFESGEKSYLKSNVTKVGSLVDNQGVLSEFSNSNYAVLPMTFAPTNNDTWEMVFKTTLSGFGSTYYLIGSGGTSAYNTGVTLSVSSSGYLNLYATSNGSSWNIAGGVSSSIALSTGTYYVKVEFTGSQYVVSVSSDGDSYVNHITVSSTTPVYEATSPNALGHEHGSAAIYRGTIDLNECYINVNGQRFWSGTDTITKNPNGHLFYDISEKDKIDELYNTYGIAWYYGIDTNAERVFLPRDNYFAVKSVAPVVGNGMTLGLTDGTNNAGFVQDGGTNNYLCSRTASYGENVGFSASGDKLTTGSLGITTDPTKSGIETHLQPDKTKYLYICVGNTNVESAVTDVVDVTTTENDTVPLFTGMYFDFTPNNVSWLKAGEQANSGGIYKFTYNELVNILNGVTKYGDLKVINIADMEVGVDYSEYWKVNQEDMTFITPTTISNKALSGGVKGNGMTLGLTDGVYNTGLYDSDSGNAVQSVNTVYGQPYGAKGTNDVSASGALGVTTDPTKSGIIAEQSTSQLYFKVANAVQNLELLDAGEVLEAVTFVGSQLNTVQSQITTVETSMIRPPNYSAFIGLTPENGMVIDEDCWLQIITKHVDRSNTRTMTLDGLPIIRQLSANDNSSSQPDFMCWLGFVKKGSTIAYSGFNSVSMWKVPLL